ncbi:uncharacterized protein KQ657_003229 [Scheffersomyces spartinae]|uniref:GATA-type domain-containing protein n=1 Tax=Scheffersomyces spartinae TaxID=45513 RepID=A0A9P8AK32_9ASCO|nr:uncharacterized protein KQ657_003229 [Scheffersomyces spartinae]KAG7195467.1 hypothetical protein KQ657_003229 [Scheffersomyces spartinae]
MSENTIATLEANYENKLPSFSSLVLSFSSGSDSSSDHSIRKDVLTKSNLYGRSASTTPLTLQAPHTMSIGSLNSVYFDGKSPFKKVALTDIVNASRTPLECKFPMTAFSLSPNYSVTPVQQQRSGTEIDPLHCNTSSLSEIIRITPKGPIDFDGSLKTFPKRTGFVRNDYSDTFKQLMTSLDGVGVFQERVQRVIGKSDCSNLYPNTTRFDESSFANVLFNEITMENIDNTLSSLQEALKVCHRLKSERIKYEQESKQKENARRLSSLIELRSPIRLKVKKTKHNHPNRRNSALDIPGLDVIPLTVNRVKVEDWEKYNLQQQGGLNVELSIKRKVVCLHCGIKSTPEWRKGPDGNRSLCNACGLFFTKLVKKHGNDSAARILRERKEENRILDRRV